MADVQWSRVLIGCLLASLMALAGCGAGNNEEVVHLHFFNAYPGASSMSVYGPSGVVARDLPFGERTAEPVAVNRNLGDEFTILLQGAPEPFEVAIPVWSMYPHETGTVLFKRRTGRDTIDTPVLYRHVQTGYSVNQGQQACRLVLDNALSGETSNLFNASYVPAFKLRPACMGYRFQIGSFEDPRGQGFIDAVANAPWFYPIEASEDKTSYIKNGQACPAYSGGTISNQDGDTVSGAIVIPGGTIDFVWAGASNGIRNFEDEEGTLIANPTTADVMTCLGWDPLVPKSEQEELLQDQQKLADCLSDTYELPSVRPQQEEIQYYSFGIGLGQGIPEGRCGFDIRADSDFESIFTGANLNGEPVIERAEFAPNQYYFWLIYGRPVNPRVESWGANQPEEGGGFVELPDYPGGSGSE